MKRSIVTLTLTLVASFSLAACDTSEQPKGDAPSGEAPVEVEFDFDAKTKTVTAVPTLTAPAYRPSTTVKKPTTKPKATR